jgi:hypothetical protein
MTGTISELDFQVVGMDLSRYNAGSGIRRYPEYVIDGVPLVEMLEDHDREIRDNLNLRYQVPIPTLAWPLDHDALGRLTLELGPDLPATNRYSILCCELCGDPGCGVISAEIVRDGELVTWRRFGSESSVYLPEFPDDSWFDPDAFPNVGPFHFEWNAYATILRAMHDAAEKLWREHRSQR